jgi:RNase_H superfamily
VNKLFIDIETSPHVAYVWGLYNENIGINQIIEPTRMICVAWKFDKGPMQFASEWGEYRGKPSPVMLDSNREKMVKAVHDAVEKADAIIHFNGTSFDERHLNREFLQAGLKPPQRPQTIDLYRAIKNKFYFASNKLAQVSKELEIRDGKIKTDFDLWANVLAGDIKAQKLMERYNKEDVNLLVDLYDKILPWIDRHPNVALYKDDDRPRCTRCGSDHVTKHSIYRTSAGRFQRYLCSECGSTSRMSKRMGTTPLREA